jgi:hypothetical protein
MGAETAVAQSWRDEDATRRRCEVTVYNAEDVGAPGSGPEPFASLMEAIAPLNWRWVSVEFIEADDRYVRQRPLRGEPDRDSRELDEALARMATEIQQARELLREGAITDPDDVPSLYSLGRAWIAADRERHALIDHLEGSDDDDDER